MSSNEPRDSGKIDYDDPKYRITPFQQAAASCTGAVITSLFGMYKYSIFKQIN